MKKRTRQQNNADQPWKGVPLAMRSPDMIRLALDGQEQEVVEAALRLHAHAVDQDLGLTKLAHRTNITSGMLSDFFSGQYGKSGGDMVAIAERIQDYFWKLEQAALYGSIREYVETALSRDLCALFEKTRIIRRIQIIQSPEQLGKSRVASEYAHRNNSGRTIYVTLSGGRRNGLTDFIYALADALGIPYTVKTCEKRLRIRERLKACDLIIIDEAHLMWDWTARSVKEFLDYLRTDVHSNGARGVVLIATNTDMMDGIRHVAKAARYNVGQLLGRMRNDVVEIDPAEDITEEDVLALTSRYYEPGEKTLARLTDIARRKGLGHFGLLLDIMNEAWSVARAEERELTDTIVNRTIKDVLRTLEGRGDLYTERVA